MRSHRKLWTVALGTSAIVLVTVNVIYAVINAPDLAAKFLHSKDKDWFHEPDCEDASPNCKEWVDQGGCEWSWQSQAFCKSSCERCHSNVAPLHSIHPFAGLVGFRDVAETMQYNVAAAHVAADLEAARNQIEKSNFLRAANSPVDLVSCRPSTQEHTKADLSHYAHLATDFDHAGSLNEACAFHLVPRKIKAQCEDQRTCTAKANDCMGHNFRHFVHLCPKTCGQCDMCLDQHESCREWSTNGQCRTNAEFMLKECPHSCIKTCSTLYDPHPPYFVSLWNGLLMPTIGFGTAGLSTGTTAAVAQALDMGYRHIDTAAAREWYREDLVGEALRESSATRDALFITTKIHPKNLGYQSTLHAFSLSLRDLGTSYVDLLLLHYAECFPSICEKTPDGTWKDSWRAMEDLVRQGKALALGVSNFSLKQLVELVEFATIPPAVIQRHSDPFVQDLAIRRFALSLGIQYAAYSSLGTQHLRRTGGVNPVLTNPAIKTISESIGSSAAQAVLKYTLGTGQIILPRSQTPSHMNESLYVHATQFAADDILLFQSLDGRLRHG